MNKLAISEVPIGEVVERVAKWDPSQNPNEEFTYIDLSSVNQATKEITETVGRSMAERVRSDFAV